MKKNKGITMIALVITITVLSILAGVTLKLTVGEQGVIEQAQQITTDYKEGEEREKEETDNYKKEISEILKDEPYEDNNVEIGDNVARIRKNLYPTLQDAINAVPETNASTEIVLLKDVSENVNISQNKNVVLNLNSKTIENNNSKEPIIDLNGKLKLKNGNVIGTYTEKVSAIIVEASGDIEIVNAKIDRNSEDESLYSTLLVYGKSTINSGSINSPNSNAIYAEENSNIKVGGNAIISSTIRPTISNYGEATITGGTLTSSSNSILNLETGVLKIGGNVIISSDSETAPLVYNFGEATITGGTLTSEKYSAIYNDGTGVIKIGGDANIYAASIVVYNDCGDVTITGGTLTTKEGNALCNYGEATIMGGNLISTSTNVIYNGDDNGNRGILKISEDANIYSNTSFALNNYGEATITGGNLTSDEGNAIGNRATGVLKISGNTTISSTNTGNYPTIYNYNGGSITIEGGSITSTASTTLSNYGETTITGGKLTSDAGVTFINYGEATMTGGELTSNTGVTLSNNGKATITGGNITTASSNAINNRATGVIEIGGNVNISSTSLPSKSIPTIYNTTGGKMTITGGTITQNTEGKTAIYSQTKGQITYNGNATVKGAISL